MDMNTLNAYGIANAIYDVIENGLQFDPETGEVLFTEEDLDNLKEAAETKIESIAGIIQYYEDTSDSFKKRKELVTKEIQTINKKIDYLKNLLKMLMEASGIEKSKYIGMHKVGFRRTKSVEITSEESVLNFLHENPKYQEDCLKTETKVTLIKAGLKDAIENGIEIPGAAIVENKNVTVK